MLHLILLHQTTLTVNAAAEDENWDNGTPAGPTINEDWNGGGPSGGDNFESGFESNVSKHAYDTEAKPDGDDRACNKYDTKYFYSASMIVLLTRLQAAVKPVTLPENARSQRK